MFHCSAAEGQKFQEEATRISELIKNLGNNPIKDSIRSNEPKVKNKKK
jgi:coenzyme F420-reducing hydrogenase delta subunit